MSKQVAFGAQPTKKPPPATADTWVENRVTETESSKRLTLDIPHGLHRRLKLRAASQGVTMVELVREWIEQGLANKQN